VVALKKALLILRDIEGATAIEYGLIAALVSIAAIIALASMGSSLEDLFNYVTGILQSVAAMVSGS
jgi:pilus assembly protein Flp/PilA